jgi:hypothetical protein
LSQRRTGERRASGGTPVNDTREIICKGIIILTLDAARLVRS